jgi:hypothetical protein
MRVQRTKVKPGKHFFDQKSRLISARLEIWRVRGHLFAAKAFKFMLFYQ